MNKTKQKQQTNKLTNKVTNIQTNKIKHGVCSPFLFFNETILFSYEEKITDIEKSTRSHKQASMWRV